MLGHFGGNVGEAIGIDSKVLCVRVHVVLSLLLYTFSPYCILAQLVNLVTLPIHFASTTAAHGGHHSGRTEVPRLAEIVQSRSDTPLNVVGIMVFRRGSALCQQAVATTIDTRNI